MCLWKGRGTGDSGAGDSSQLCCSLALQSQMSRSLLSLSVCIYEMGPVLLTPEVSFQRMEGLGSANFRVLRRGGQAEFPTPSPVFLPRYPVTLSGVFLPDGFPTRHITVSLRFPLRQFLVFRPLPAALLCSSPSLPHSLPHSYSPRDPHSYLISLPILFKLRAWVDQ